MAGKSTELEGGISRRGFLTGAGIVAAGAAAAGLAGCAPGSSGTQSSGTNNFQQVDAEADIHGPGFKATATLENAAPIPPESVPKNWDKEADIVVVGAGGGGLAAALYAQENGCSCILVEKDNTPGGATQHANFYANVAGTSKAQEEKHFALPTFPYNRDIFIRWGEMCTSFSINDAMFANVAEAGGECADWMLDHQAPLACIGVGFMPYSFLTNPKKHKSLTFREITNMFYQLGQQAGAEYLLSTPCEALVTDEAGAVVGIKAKGSDGDLFIKANKGVILCAGGFGMNPDMVKKYIPSGYQAVIMGGPMPSHTGEVTRQALGVGGVITAFDSWNGWESEMDNGTGDWTYFWGPRMITQLPWLNIDSAGNRCNFYEWDEFSSQDPKYTQASLPMFQNAQDRARMQVQASRPGHRAYCIFDSNFEEYMWEIANEPGGERAPLSPDLEYNDESLFSGDWTVGFQEALDDGRMHKAETLDELAEMLGLDPNVLTDAVKVWNDDCAAGKDSNTVYPLNPDFLNPIKEPPYYGAKIGARLSMTLAGLLVDEKLRVCDAEGHAIPGLYANFTTAGGMAGYGAFGTGTINGTIVGGCGLSWASGYLACKNAVEG